jgi:hypothetical protein
MVPAILLFYRAALCSLPEHTSPCDPGFFLHIQQVVSAHTCTLCVQHVTRMSVRLLSHFALQQFEKLHLVQALHVKGHICWHMAALCVSNGPTCEGLCADVALKAMSSSRCFQVGGLTRAVETRADEIGVRQVPLRRVCTDKRR